MSIFSRIRYWNNADRIGPDMLSTHWHLYFKKKMLKLCKSKFQFFHETSEVRPGAYVIGCSKIYIGQRVILRPTTMLFAEADGLETSIILEDDVMLGSGVHIYVSNHSFERADISIIDQGHTEAKPVTLRKGCWIGANVILLPGVEIGENSVVGAGSIVTKSVPSGVVFAGNPAKIIRKI